MYNNYNLEDLGERIRNVRKAVGISQEKLEEKTGISKSVIARMERGENIKLDNLLKIACCTNSSIEELIFDGTSLYEGLYDTLVKCSMEKQKFIYALARLVLEVKFV